VRGEGVDLRAITIWALFGSVDWRSLITRDDGVYDVGAYDVRSPAPRPTAIARATAAFASSAGFDHPVLDSPGWWRRPQRLYPWCAGARARAEAGDGRKLLITGATGTLGGAFARVAGHRGLPFVLTGRAELDLCDERSIAAALERHRPWAVVNAAGFVRVADAERERDACMAANAEGPARLASACARARIPLVTFSSDLVFDGTLGRPCLESDAVAPADVYGASKAAAERAVAAAGGAALVIRTSAFFGPWDVHNFAWHVLERLGRGEQVRASPRTLVSPTFVPDLCHAALDLLIDGETGLWHLANQGEISWHGFARLLAGQAGYDPSLVVADGAGETRTTALASERGSLLRPLGDAVRAYLFETGIGHALAIAAE
jgi:dTDP-4-dehydrorhamnose reductase